MECKIVAHRGFADFERENTLEAFSRAASTPGVYGIETDVHRTKDGAYVCGHDACLSRVSNGESNINVEEETLETIRKVNLPDLDGKHNENKDLFVPTLREYIQVCKSGKKKPIVELKQLFYTDQMKEILHIIDEEGMLEETTFISFCHEDLLILKKLGINKIQYLTCEFNKPLVAALKAIDAELDIYYGNLTRDDIRLLHENNIKVNAWTINDMETANNLVEAGLDYLTTNCIVSLK